MPSPRWNDEETQLLAELRESIGHDLLASVPQFVEVVGDRKLIRFLRGHNYDIDKVTEMYTSFLTWRKVHKVDEIREKIVHGGLNHPTLFPLGEKILKAIPQIVIATDALDTLGCPLVVDQYNFNPVDILTMISLEEYITFVIYCLEYRSLILEQLSEEAEKKNLAQRGNDDGSPYGVCMTTCVIRDLGAVSFDHLGVKGREIISAVIKVASDNYPELMRKCYMVNTPFIFNAAWYFIQGLLSARSAAKIMVVGTDYKKHIEKEIPLDSLPDFLGGTRKIGALPFTFDNDVDGIFPPLDAAVTLTTDDVLLQVLEKET